MISHFWGGTKLLACKISSTRSEFSESAQALCSFCSCRHHGIQTSSQRVHLTPFPRCRRRPSSQRNSHQLPEGVCPPPKLMCRPSGLSKTRAEFDRCVRVNTHQNPCRCPPSHKWRPTSQTFHSATRLPVLRLLPPRAPSLCGIGHSPDRL